MSCPIWFGLGVVLGLFLGPLAFALVLWNLRTTRIAQISNRRLPRQLRRQHARKLVKERLKTGLETFDE